jgi:hypothetical protein
MNESISLNGVNIMNLLLKTLPRMPKTHLLREEFNLVITKKCLPASK